MFAPVLSAIVLTSGVAFGQADFGNPSPRLVIESLDFDALVAEDATREANGLAPRYAVPHKVRSGPAFDGTWSQPAPDRWQWQLRVSSRGALSINVAFEHFIMPDAATMTITSSDGRFTLPPITSLDNNMHNQYWTPPVPDSEILITIDMVEKVRPFVEDGVILTSVNVGYRGFFDGAFEAGQRSGSCNYDVACDETVGWEDQIPCVAVISTGGSTFCTGFMVNNLRNDRDPLFQTANHCGVNAGNAASLVTFWNYQDPADGPLDCPGNSIDSGPQDQFISGSEFLASNAASDFTLVRLLQSPPDEWEVSYCGWSAEDVATEFSVAIHHPATDLKRWSIDYDPSEIYGYNQPGDTHIRVFDWDLGTTEPGSSGSPLFDQNKRVVGQLHGGFAACGNDLEDWYGRNAASWANGLSTYLDPDNTGTLVCDTLTGRGLSISPAGTVEHVASAGGADVTNQTVTYTLANNSPNSISWTASLTGDSFLVILSDGSGSIASGGTVDLEIEVDLETIANLANGTYAAQLIISDNTNGISVSRDHVLDLGTTLIAVTPDNDFTTGGPTGGPFPTTTFTVTSQRPTATEVSVSASEEWVEISPSSFVLNGTGDSQQITISFNESANSLANGLYEATLSFSNLTDPAVADLTRSILLDVGRFTYVATDTPLDIVDNSQFVSTISIGDSYCVADVDVEIDISHTFIGDLQIVLTSPQGTSVTLHDRTGGSSSDIVTTYSDDGDGTAADGPGSLSDFFTENSTGDWTLLVSDNAGLDQGALNSWALKIASTGLSCPPISQDVTISTDAGTPVEIQLLGSSVENGALDFIITSLPDNSTLSDAAGVITGTPYIIPGGGSTVTLSPDDADAIYVDTFTYRVDDGTPSSESLVTVNVGALPNPDNCSDALLVGNGSYEFDTTAATTDGPTHSECEFDGQTYFDIWYAYEACDDGTLLVSTCDTADYDTDLVVYDGIDCGSPVLLGCNDDADGCSNYSSSLSIPVTRGQSYLIRLGGWDDGETSQGTGTLLIDGPTTGCDVNDCPADLTGDGVVNVDDVLRAISSFGSDAGGDVDGNGETDVNDLLAVLTAFGEPC